MSNIFYPGQTDYIAKLNTLADTVTGTFVPVLSGTTLAGTGTYTPGTVIGRYTRVDNLVTFNLTLSWTAHTGTGNMLIQGLPPSFPSLNVANFNTPVTVYYNGILVTASNVVNGYIAPNSTNIVLTQVAASGAPIAIPMDTIGTLFINGTYFIA